MMKMKILSVLALSAGLVACGGDSSPSVPTRDELVAQIVDAGGVDQVVAECAADALFSNLTEADLTAVVAGGDPSAEAQTAFTNAVLDCLSGPLSLSLRLVTCQRLMCQLLVSNTRNGHLMLLQQVNMERPRGRHLSQLASQMS